MLILGTRPEIIKMAPVIKALQKKRDVNILIIHSGQHYDFEMSQILFDELNLPSADINLKVGSGTHSTQTAKMLIHYEEVITKYKPNLVLAEGDTNTVVAAGLASIKLQVPFGHVEAGLRCYDRTMPEEINRTLADDCAEICFAPNEWAALNLLYEGIPPHKIFVTGNPIVDQCLLIKNKLNKQSNIISKFGLNKKQFLLVTLHRSETVDNKEKLEKIINSFLKMEDLYIVFPLHPRTRKKLIQYDLLSNLQKAIHIKLTSPLGYFDFLNLLTHTKIVITDSGGIQEEAFTYGKPCITLRDNTERPETIWAGANFLVGNNGYKIEQKVRTILNDTGFEDRIKKIKNPFGDGLAGEKIASICIEQCKKNISIISPTYLQGGSIIYRIHQISKSLENTTVTKFEKKFPELTISLIYDNKGIPYLPKPKIILKKDWKIRIFGDVYHINNFEKQLNNQIET